MKELKVSKKVVADIEKCYAVCPTTIRGKKGFLIGTEKAGGCFFFDMDGELKETVWDDPGGIMSLVPLPNGDGAFLSTQEFYSPNDSKNARIVLAIPKEDGWEVRTLTALPFVHRFDILSTPDQDYLIACTLKSDHHYRDDWEHPGTVYVCPLPEDITDPDFSPEFEVLVDNLTKNHGYYHCEEDGAPFVLVSSENGVLKIKPPAAKGSDWQVEKILDQASSDATLIDLDQDGVKELVTLSPFHGDNLNIFRLVNGKYELDYSWPEKIEFLHAIWCGNLNGKPTVVIGHRKGERDLFALRYDPEAKTYIRQRIDHDHGPANVAVVTTEEGTKIIATNRETNEVALYTIAA